MNAENQNITKKLNVVIVCGCIIGGVLAYSNFFAISKWRSYHNDISHLELQNSELNNQVQELELKIKKLSK